MYTQRRHYPRGTVNTMQAVPETSPPVTVTPPPVPRMSTGVTLAPGAAPPDRVEAMAQQAMASKNRNIMVGLPLQTLSRDEHAALNRRILQLRTEKLNVRQGPYIAAQGAVINPFGGRVNTAPRTESRADARLRAAAEDRMRRAMSTGRDPFITFHDQSRRFIPSKEQIEDIQRKTRTDAIEASQADPEAGPVPDSEAVFSSNGYVAPPSAAAPAVSQTPATGGGGGAALIPLAILAYLFLG